MFARRLQTVACGIVLLCVFLGEAVGQYHFDYWTADDGLPQNSVYSILQTPDGYVWFTTLDGLVRFDGVRFTVFNRGNSPGLTTNRLIHLFAEDDNTLWVGTEDGGLLRFRNGEFRAFTVADGLPSSRIDKVVKDSRGNLFAAASTGLARLEGEKFVRLSDASSKNYALYFARSGARWQLDQSGLQKSENGQATRYALPFDFNRIAAERTFNQAASVQMLEDRLDRGVLWLTAAGNLYRLKNGAFTAFTKRDGVPTSLIRALAQDAAGSIWLGTQSDGLCRFAENKARCFTTADGLSSDSVRDLYIDRENTLWAATGERGINRVARQTITSVSKKEGLADANIYPLLEDSRGNFWIGANSALSLYRDGKITNYARRDGLLYEIVQSLFEDRDGRLWIGSVGGVQYLQNDKFTDFVPDLGLTFGEYNFWDIHQTPDGAMWFATDKGLYKYENARTTRFTVADGLPADDVKKIFERQDGSLWFGTIGGLARLDAGKFRGLTEKDGLVGNHVRTIWEDQDGWLWIGTYDSGLSLYRDGKFTNFTVKNGLFSNGAFEILPDARGNFWMSSNQGIYRADRRQLIDFADGKISSVVSTAFDKSDGMLSVECNGGRQPAGIRARDGKLWFPTQDGVAIVDPEAAAFNLLPPPVAIENIKIENQFLDRVESVIELQPGQNYLEIQYTGLSFIKPEQIRFRYKLEGLDDDWTDAGGRRAAFYSYLPPGKYQFRVAAANSDNVWNERGAQIEITVKPPFYRTWWFVLLSFGVVLALAYLAFDYRVRQLQKKSEQQETFSRQLIQSQERERKRIAVELHDSLGQQLLVIKNWAMLELAARGENNRSREALDEISVTASTAIDEVREIIYGLRPYQLDKIGLTKTLRFMIEKVAAASNIEFTLEIDDIDNLFDYDSEITLYRVVQECLNNIIKHSEAARAVVVIERDAQTVRLRIEDDGRGFAPETVAADAESKGFGLTGIGERVRMLGGSYKTVSSPGNGTKIEVMIVAQK